VKGIGVRLGNWFTVQFGAIACPWDAETGALMEVNTTFTLVGAHWPVPSSYQSLIIAMTPSFPAPMYLPRRFLYSIRIAPERACNSASSLFGTSPLGTA
jgi:hypothetical protein